MNQLLPDVSFKLQTLRDRNRGNLLKIARTAFISLVAVRHAVPDVAVERVLSFCARRAGYLLAVPWSSRNHRNICWLVKL